MIEPSWQEKFAGVRPPQSERVRKVRFSFDDLNLEFAHWFVHVDLGTHQRGWLIWSWKAQTWSSGSAILDRKQFFGFLVCRNLGTARRFSLLAQLYCHPQRQPEKTSHR